MRTFLETNKDQIETLEQYAKELKHMVFDLDKQHSIVAANAINDASVNIEIAIGALRYELERMKENRVVL